MSKIYNIIFYLYFVYDDICWWHLKSSALEEAIFAAQRIQSVTPTSARKMAQRLLLVATLVILAHELASSVAVALPDHRYFSKTRVVQSVLDPFIRDAAEVTRDVLEMSTLSIATEALTRRSGGSLRSMSSSCCPTRVSTRHSRSTRYSTRPHRCVLVVYRYNPNLVALKAIAKVTHWSCQQLGDFHYVTHLRMLLASPHFASRKPLETFEMMVLERKAAPPSVGLPTSENADYNPRSIAIDEFPIMDEAAIEQFWIRKVEDRRRRRRELFAKWEADESDIEAMETPQAVRKKTLLSIEQLEGMPTSELRGLLDNRASSQELRDAVTRIIDDRMDKLQRLERGERPHVNTQKDEL
jgi:hypothetical protein